MKKDPVISNFLCNGKNMMVAGRIVIALLLILWAIMVCLSRNDVRLFRTLVVFVLPLLIQGGLFVTSNLANPLLSNIRKIVHLLWWAAMISGIVYTFIHYDNPGMAIYLWGFIFLIAMEFFYLIPVKTKSY